MSNQPPRHARGHFCRPHLSLLAWTLIIGQIACCDALAQGRGKSQAITQPDTASAADTKDIGQDWVRMKYDAKGDPIAMQTAIVRYVPTKSAGKAGAKSVSVDLIGAVHIGDAAYYRRLNERFKQYDALLYELVAPEGTVVPLGRGTSNTHPIGALQNFAKDMLDLDHQLEYIDYTKPNFIHADMSPAEFEKAMADRHESFLQMYFKLMGAAMAQQSKLDAQGSTSDVDLFTALFSKDRARRLKIILAKQLSEMESLMVSFGGEDGSAIISERNKKALGVLKTQLAKGKKHIGIFYGAGHLRDMDEHMRNDFHMQPVSITWLTAWNLAPKP
ncbi:MAG TPA: hypothetical protein VFW73_00370 [Lacipirellulaceae bacterium]|nr:hypothetical protein [Lacipirellulaceae bacterium]